ncbi:hypothetical protein [Kriegella aquimaris]|nr:hypothetical protein [Kriegella aquimaris]
MKKLLLYFFIFSPMIICSQNSQIKEIKFEGKSTEENKYIEILKLKDRNALIIQIGYSSYPIKGLDSDLIVYLNNGQVKLYKVSESVGSELKPKIKRGRLKKNEYSRYWKFLNTCISKEKFKIDKAKLNLENKENTTLPLAISAGQTYHFRLHQNKKYTIYSSFAPKIYISLKSQGFEEMQRLVDLMEGFKNMINKN